MGFPLLMHEAKTITSAPLTSDGSVPLERLQNERWLLRESGSGTRRVLEDALGRYAFRLRRSMELAGCEAVKRGVMAGMGIAAVSGYAVGVEMRHGLLKAISVYGLLLEREISIVSRKEVRPTAAALAFTALAHKCLPPTPEP